MDAKKTLILLQNEYCGDLEHVPYRIYRIMYKYDSVEDSLRTL